MNKIVKFVALPLACLVVVFMAVAAYFAVTFDPNRYKPQIVQAVKDKTQRTLTLDGDIKLSFFPDIGATLGKASLSEHGSDKEFAGADDFRIVLKLRPLLSNQVVVDAIEATNLHANLIRYKDGKTNFDDLIASGYQAESGVSGKEPVTIEISHVTIKNATIVYMDQKAGGVYSLSSLNLKTGRLASGKPAKIELSLMLQSDQPKLRLEADLKTMLTFDFEQQRYAFADLDLSAKGLAAGIENLQATAQADINAQLASSELLIGKLAVAASGTLDGSNLNVKLEAPRLSLSGDLASGENIALDAVMTGPRSKLTAKFSIPGIQGSARSVAAGQVSASIDLQQEGTTTKVRLSGPLAANVETKRIELSRLAANLSVANSKLLRNPIAARANAAAQIDLARQNANLTFAAKVDDSSISGKAGLVGFAPAFYTFDVHIDRLDADRYLQPRRPQDKPLDLSALKSLNANGSVRIGVLTLANVKASDVQIDVKGANPRGDVRPLTAHPSQSSSKRTLPVNAATPQALALRRAHHEL